MDVKFTFFELLFFGLISCYLIVGMLNSTKDEFTRNAILSERIRTLLYLSLHLKKPISVLLLKSNETINKGIVQSGIVTRIENGSGWKKWYQRYIGGQFSLGIKNKQGNEITFNFDDIIAVSLTLQQDPKLFLDSNDTVNKIQHIRPFTGLNGDGDSGESYFYQILSKFFRT